VEPIKKFSSKTVVIPATNIDTDQIIPARFLTTTTREGLGKSLFNEWRYDAPEAQGSGILVAGRNFGCGSSREHAPWALVDYGFRAVISTEIADIFRNNSLKNGLLPIVVDETTSAWLIAHPGAEVTVDLAAGLLTLPIGSAVSFPIEAFARYCLLNGVDELGFLLDRMPQIQAYERAG
jgi:3-isopropylmalate/(R)-2-methylmalate dehydratase small subunit